VVVLAQIRPRRVAMTAAATAPLLRSGNCYQ
jgi:hypothetical protein